MAIPCSRFSIVRTTSYIKAYMPPSQHCLVLSIMSLRTW
jgi:hypothetical protein